MRHQDDAAAPFGERMDGRHDAVDPRAIRELAVLEGRIEIDAQKDALAAGIKVGEGAEGHASKKRAIPKIRRVIEMTAPTT